MGPEETNDDELTGHEEPSQGAHNHPRQVAVGRRRSMTAPSAPCTTCCRRVSSTKPRPRHTTKPDPWGRYAESKSFAEDVVIRVSEADVCGVVLRLPNVYGR